MKAFFINIWNLIKAFLKFFGLIDEQGQLSRTNILVYVFTVKFAFVPMETASIHDMALALGALGVYMGKKVVNAYVEGKKATSVSSDIINKINTLNIAEEEAE